MAPVSKGALLNIHYYYDEPSRMAVNRVGKNELLAVNRPDIFGIESFKAVKRLAIILITIVHCGIFVPIVLRLRLKKYKKNNT